MTATSERESYTIDLHSGGYTRTQSTERTILARTLTGIYNAKAARVCASGMNAIYITLDALAKHFQRGVFYISKHLYCDVHAKVIPDLKIRYPEINFVTVDMYTSDPEDLDDANVVYLEACSNPHSYVHSDKLFEHVPKHAYIVVDNTWLSPVVYNPFTHGAHIVVESTAKYLSGGTCILGAVIFKSDQDAVLKLVNTNVLTFGIHVSPEYCTRVIHMLKSLPARIEASYARTQLAVGILLSLPGVDHVFYPSERDRSNFVLVRTLRGLNRIDCVNLGPSVIYFHVKCVFKPKSEIRAYVGSRCSPGGDDLHLRFDFKTSFGHRLDSIDCYPKRDPTGVWIRMALGYADASPIEDKIRAFIQRIEDPTFS